MKSLSRRKGDDEGGRKFGRQPAKDGPGFGCSLLYPCPSHPDSFLCLAPKTSTPSRAKVHPRGRCRVVRRLNCERYLKRCGHPGGITSPTWAQHATSSAGCQAFWGPFLRSHQCRLQPLTSTIHPTMAALNRQAASDEKAKTGGCSLGAFVFARPGCCNSRLLAGIDDPSGTRTPDSLLKRPIEEEPQTGSG
jgi:hypothetical protein